MTSVPTEKGEPMVDCKKCLHAPVCEKLPKMPGAIIAECAEFKDSTKWVERPKGRWEWRGGIPWCTNCGEMPPDYSYGGDANTTQFCPNCGADMRGESE